MAVYQNELGQTLEKKLYDRFGYDVPTDPRFFIDLGLAGLLEKDRLDRGYKIYLLLNPFAVKDAAFNAP